MEPARGEAVMSADGVVPLDSESGVKAENSPGAGAAVLGRYHKWAVLALVAAIFTGLGGASAGVTLAAARDGAVSPTHVVALQHTFLAAFRGALLACAGLGAIGILAALVRGQDRIARQKEAYRNSCRTPRVSIGEMGDDK